jgi:hypothetical protein
VARTSNDDRDIEQLDPPPPRILLATRNVFGVIGAIGALAFLAHAVIFYLAFHYGAAAPTGAQNHRIVSHSDTAYVNDMFARTIFILQVAFVVGLGIGVTGCLAAESLARWLSRRARA